jgi:xylulose-5-phosphate/fructose-6-phosphate phosphoketolase
VSDRCFVGKLIDIDDHISHEGRVMEVLSEHNCHGWLRATRSPAGTGSSRPTRRSRWSSTRWRCNAVARALPAHPWRKPVPSLNYLLTSTCWRNDHNGFSHQGRASSTTSSTRSLPSRHAARRELAALRRRPLLPQPQYRT